MRARKLAVAFDDAPPPDEVSEIYADEEPSGGEEPGEPIGKVCIACGDASGDGCEHREVARLDAPSRAVAEAVRRLRRAAAGETWPPRPRRSPRPARAAPSATPRSPPRRRSCRRR